MKYFFPLEQATNESQFGGKAFQLSKLISWGLPVPPGGVISGDAFSEFYVNSESSSQLKGHWNLLKDEINAFIGTIDWEGVMVRSSAVGEDSADNSFAGQLDSFIVLNPSKVKHQTAEKIAVLSFEDAIWNAVLKCWESYNNQRSKTYKARSGAELSGMAVVIQELIQPDFAGVMFSRSHLSDSEVLIEFVAGHGEQLVSGGVTPISLQIPHPPKRKMEKSMWDEYWGNAIEEFAKFRINSDQIVLSKTAFLEGFEHLIQIEGLYKRPVDIEFAIKNGRFYLVQARAITTVSKRRTVFWSNTNVNENYPDPMSPLLYSIARQSYYHYFKNLSVLFQVPTETIRSLEPEYSNVIGAFGGKMYYNMSSIHRILSSAAFSDLLIGSFDHFVGYSDGRKSEKRSGVWKEKLWFIQEFLRFNLSLEKHVSDFERLVDDYRDQANSALVYEDYQRVFHGFVEIRMHRWFKASLADFNAMVFHGVLGKLCAKFYGEEGTSIQNKLIQAIPNLISTQPVIEMHDIVLHIRNSEIWLNRLRACTASDFWDFLQNERPNFKVQIDNYLLKWGFRCSGELMLITKNYLDEPTQFIKLLQQYEHTASGHPQKLIEEKYKESLLELKGFLSKVQRKYALNPVKGWMWKWVIQFVLRNAQRGISARERARLKQAELYHYFKVTVFKIGEIFQKEGIIEDAMDVLYLTYFEIIELLEASVLSHEHTKIIISNRKKEEEILSKKKYPDDFYSELGKFYEPDEVICNTSSDNKELDANTFTGLCACGGKLQGRIVVLESVSEVGKIQKGDILVTRQTDPGWIVVFPLISGLIVERGGMLSHGAIVSREFGIPAVVGVNRATELLKDGDWVELNADFGKVVLMDKNEINLE
jgi:pyruvate,water dikinase